MSQTEYVVEINENAPAVIGATGLDDINQCIRYIVLCVIYSCPMDRGFANTGRYIDAPIPHAAAMRIAELTEAIEKNEPRVRVTSIKIIPAGQQAQDAASAAMDGRTRPVIRYRLREGATV